MVNGTLVSDALLFEPMLNPLFGRFHRINKSVKLDVSERFSEAIGKIGRAHV